MSLKNQPVSVGLCCCLWFWPALSRVPGPCCRPRPLLQAPPLRQGPPPPAGPAPRTSPAPPAGLLPGASCCSLSWTNTEGWMHTSAGVMLCLLPPAAVCGLEPTVTGWARKGPSPRLTMCLTALVADSFSIFVRFCCNEIILDFEFSDFSCYPVSGWYRDEC